ncbi:hypothetical protein BJY04DRAFT_196523 [Aspergillus karnatakaensis]|uniref:uncharacterized protein n=1 Tax=Aspergillus karnatakaensis TaxID=1810916 RepID=UPI003CCE1980
MSLARDGSRARRWGYQIYTHTDSFQSTWFKLMLDPEADFAQFQSGDLETATGTGIRRLLPWAQRPLKESEG